MLDGRACADVQTTTVLDDDFLLLCGDVIFDIDFNRFIAFHKQHQAWASLMAHPNGHPYDSSLLVTETLEPQEKGGLPIESHRVIGWLNKEDERTYYKNRVNAGIEIISPALLAETMNHFTPRHPEQPDKIDLDRDVLKPNIKSGRIFAYDTSEYIKDMGTPDRYYEVEKDLQSGKVAARNLSKKQKAIFLDRDGTINIYKGFLTKEEDFELIPGVTEAIKLINRSGYLAIIVSNQPIIARGDCTFEELQTIHDKMETLLGKEGAFVDAIYYCPHHTDKGFEGERPEYKFDCDCRKPKPGLLLQAAKDWNIDLAKSYMIGDTDRDIEAGDNAGCKQSFLIQQNEPDALLDIVKHIL
jgi:D,D-heptose 1,7-bisphosphate phosphatase